MRRNINGGRPGCSGQYYPFMQTAGCEAHTAGKNPRSSKWQLPVHSALNARTPTLSFEGYCSKNSANSQVFFKN